MSDNYYPRHGGEQGASSEELHIAWLEDRVTLLEQVLRDIRDVCSLLPMRSFRNARERIDEVLKASKP